MGFHENGEFVAHRRRKIAHQLVGKIRILADVGVQQFLEQANLAIGQQHGDLGAGQTFLGRFPLGDIVIGREEFQLAFKTAFLFEHAYQLGVIAQ